MNLQTLRDHGSSESLRTEDSWKKKARFMAIAGVGFFADGYLNITIGLGKLEILELEFYLENCKMIVHVLTMIF
jgi:hypothetical protein